MKKWIILATMFVTVPAMAWVSNVEYSWKETQCHICGKPIYYEFEFYSGPYMLTDDDPWYGQSLSPGPESFDFSYPENHICKECVNKYQEKIDKAVNWILNGMIEDSSKVRKQYDEERRSKTVRERTSRIRALERELKELKGN